MSLTALCNIYINSESKYRFFQQTFPEVYGVSDNWLIYIRGQYSDKAVDFIKKNHAQVSSNCTFYTSLDDANWAKSTSHILQDAKYSHVYIYSEDHILLRPLTELKKVVAEAVECSIDHFSYSFFNIGISDHSAELVRDAESSYFNLVNLTPEKWKFLKQMHPHYYPFSLVSIVSKSYLEELLRIEKRFLFKLPFLLQAGLELVFGMRAPRNLRVWFKVNSILKYFGSRVVIYTPASPFNLERSLYNFESSLFPKKMGVLKHELFANADDDNILPNSCLLKRGLYPSRLKSEYDLSDSENRAVVDHVIKRGQGIEGVFYPDIQRIYSVPQKMISVAHGKITVAGNNESYTLSQGEDIIINANIPHRITAVLDSSFTTTLVF